MGMALNLAIISFIQSKKWLKSRTSVLFNLCGMRY